MPPIKLLSCSFLASAAPLLTGETAGAAAAAGRSSAATTAMKAAFLLVVFLVAVAAGAREGELTAAAAAADPVRVPVAGEAVSAAAAGVADADLSSLFFGAIKGLATAAEPTGEEARTIEGDTPKRLDGEAGAGT